MADINLDEVLAQARPKVIRTRVCLRGDLDDLHNQLEQQLVEAKRLDETLNRHAEAPAIQQQIDAVVAEIQAAEVEFEFTAIGRKAWTDLLAEHPPTEDQRELGYAWDEDTFPQAAVMASATNPKITPAQMDKILTVLNVAQFAKLAGAALQANARDVSIPFSAAASAILSGSETKSA